jgi:hypothetical protein
MDRHPAVISLAATFTCLTAQSSGLMLDDNRRFNFIAMLSTGATTSLGT